MARGQAPQRSCVACRKVRPQRELLRIVRTLSGEIQADPGGKTPGRGAYLCPAEECVQAALRQRKLERALGKPPARETMDKITALAARPER